MIEDQVKGQGFNERRAGDDEFKSRKYLNVPAKVSQGCKPIRPGPQDSCKRKLRLIPVLALRAFHVNAKASHPSLMQGNDSFITAAFMDYGDTPTRSRHLLQAGQQVAIVNAIKTRLYEDRAAKANIGHVLLQVVHTGWPGRVVALGNHRKVVSFTYDMHMTITGEGRDGTRRHGGWF